MVGSKKHPEASCFEKGVDSFEELRIKPEKENYLESVGKGQGVVDEGGSRRVAQIESQWYAELIWAETRIEYRIKIDAG